MTTSSSGYIKLGMDSYLEAQIFVCTGFENARRCVSMGKTKRAGLLGTQSIRGGRSRRVLEKIKNDGDIFFGVSDRDWILDGASVHISMVGFDDGTENTKILDGKPAREIFANLTSRTVDLKDARKLAENENIAFQGVIKSGDFDISDGQAKLWDEFPNPNGKPNSDVLKPVANGRDIIGRPSDRWIIDFGVDMPEREAMRYQQPYEYLYARVKPQRAKMRGSESAKWWLHHRPRPAMREALHKLERYLVTPRISKHRLFQWVQQPTLPDSALHVFARDDDFFFGVLHSRPHEVWALAMGNPTRVKTSIHSHYMLRNVSIPSAKCRSTRQNHRRSQVVVRTATTVARSGPFCPRT